jgi:hypothetical protein
MIELDGKRYLVRGPQFRVVLWAEGATHSRFNRCRETVTIESG